MNVSDLAIQLCLHPRKVNAVIPFDDEVYIEFPVLPSRLETVADEDYVSIVCLETLIISIDHGSVSNTDELVEALTSHFRLAKTSVAESTASVRSTSAPEMKPTTALTTERERDIAMAIRAARSLSLVI